MKVCQFLGARRCVAIALGIASAATLSGCGGGSMGSGGNGNSGPTASTGFVDTALAVDKAEVVATAMTIDANLQNPWGIAFAPGQPFWIADNNSNLATLYTGTGTNETSAVTGSDAVGISIPASGAGVPANPTGQVYNGNGGFMVATPSGSESALFLYDGEGGTIAAWAKDSGATATTAYDDGVANGANHAVYKGLALGSVGGVHYLYATDLHNNKIDVFDTNFAKPAALQGKFIDPTMPAGFVPFGIAWSAISCTSPVPKQDAPRHDEITGAGLGYVDIFDTSGDFVSRFAAGGALNAPWGIALAPTGFGSFAGDVLIGNFGDGKINAFVPHGSFARHVRRSVDGEFWSATEL